MIFLIDSRQSRALDGGHRLEQSPTSSSGGCAGFFFFGPVVTVTICEEAGAPGARPRDKPTRANAPTASSQIGMSYPVRLRRTAAAEAAARMYSSPSAQLVAPPNPG